MTVVHDARWPTDGTGANKRIGDMTPAERASILRPVEDHLRSTLTPEGDADDAHQPAEGPRDHTPVSRRLGPLAAREVVSADDRGRRGCAPGAARRPSPATSAARRRPSTLTAQELAQVRPVERAAVSPTGRIEFRIQRELRNDNARNRNPHWSKKHTKRLFWQTSLCNALVLSIGHAAACQLLVPDSGLFGAIGTRVQERRSLEITRLVPSKRHLIRDTFDNLPWSAKELRDAIKHLGLIRDDSDKWTDTTIRQELSVDGTWWTWIAIDAPRATTEQIRAAIQAGVLRPDEMRERETT